MPANTSRRITPREEKRIKNANKRQLVVQLSGFPKHEKRILSEIVIRLGGVYHPEAAFDARCTVVVIKKPCRSEKFLCGLALGIPIVTEFFLLDSNGKKKWQDPLSYIWRCLPAGCSSDDIPAELLSAPQRCLDRIRLSSKKAYSNWTCAVKVQDSSSTAVYKRILSTGGARVVDINLDIVTSTKNIPAGLTHLFTENHFQSQLSTVAKNSVHCVTADYIGDFVIKGGEPQTKHYIVPYCDVIEILDDSPADISDSNSSVMFLSERKAHSPQELDSDVEILCVFSPKKKNSTHMPVRPLAANGHGDRLPANLYIKSEPPSSAGKKKAENHLSGAVIDRGLHNGHVELMEVKHERGDHVPSTENHVGEKRPSVDNGFTHKKQKLSGTECDNMDMREHLSHSSVTGVTPHSVIHPTPVKGSSVTNWLTANNQDDESPSSSEFSQILSQSLSQRPGSPGSAKKYTKLLKLTPTNTPTKDSLSQSQSQSQHSSTVHVTPVKSDSHLSQTSNPSPFKSPFKSPSTNTTFNKSSSSTKSATAFRRKSKKPPIMQSGALLKFFTPKSKHKTEPVSPTKTKTEILSSPVIKKALLAAPVCNNEKSAVGADNSLLLSNDIHPLDDSEMFTDTQCAADTAVTSVSTTAADSTCRQSESCLGILDGLSRLSIDERGQLYTFKLLMDESSQIPLEEEIDLTDDFNSLELKEIPVLLRKQIEIYFEDGYIDENMNGVELMESCTSERHHTTAALLCNIYDLLLSTTSSHVACNLYASLRDKLLVSPPIRRIYEEDSESPSKLLRTRRMRLIYMASLSNKRPGIYKSFFQHLNLAVQTIVAGGITPEAESQSLSQTQNHQDSNTSDRDLCIPSLFDSQPETGSPLCTPRKTPTKGGTTPDPTRSKLGCELFIQYLCQLLEDDYLMAKSYQDSILHHICKGGFFGANLVDSKDSKLLFSLTESLILNKDLETGSHLIRLISLIAQMCRPDSFESTNHAAATIISRLRDIIGGCEYDEAEDILLTVLPPWLAYRVILSILEDKTCYSSQLIADSLSSTSTQNEPQQSLTYLLRNYFYLIPTETEMYVTDDSGDNHLSVPVSVKPNKSTVKVKRNHKGETPLHTACIKGDIDRVTSLLNDQSTDVNARDNAGWTPLHEACNHGHLEIVELLLKHQSPHYQADGNGRVDLLASGGDDEMTPLHDAVNVCRIDVVRLLLKHGGRKLVLAKSKFGTPMDIVNNTEIETLLTAALFSEETEHKSLQYLAPSPDVYKSQKCSCEESAITRYVIYCLDALSLYISAYPLTDSDQLILNKLSQYIQPYIHHITWLNSAQNCIPDILKEKLSSILLMSV